MAAGGQTADFGALFSGGNWTNLGTSSWRSVEVADEYSSGKVSQLNLAHFSGGISVPNLRLQIGG